MTIIEALRVVRNKNTASLAEYVDATEEIDGLLKSYNVLAPKAEDWAAFPWAKWYAIDACGASYWYEYEPEVHMAIWIVLGKDSARSAPASIVPVLVGLDWRDCKWMRPEEGKGVQP